MWRSFREVKRFFKLACSFPSSVKWFISSDYEVNGYNVVGKLSKIECNPYSNSITINFCSGQSANSDHRKLFFWSETVTEAKSTKWFDHNEAGEKDFLILTKHKYDIDKLIDNINHHTINVCGSSSAIKCTTPVGLDPLLFTWWLFVLVLIKVISGTRQIILHHAHLTDLNNKSFKLITQPITSHETNLFYKQHINNS